MDAAPEVGLSRKEVGANDRFEKEALDFHRKVREGFLKLARENPKRWVIIDAALSPQEIEKFIWDRTNRLLKKA
jgi:dTMP kinase